MNLLFELLFFYRRKIEPGFRVDKKALVIDIGSGDKPFWRADVFVDKLSLGDVQRTTKTATVHNIGKFVDSDVKKMPFRDKAFDFSFCSHLLEHVDDPKAVIREIVRISKSGYMEVPNGILETITPFDSHLWLVFRDNDKLLFFRKSKKLHDILLKNSAGYNSLLSKVEEPFIRLYWKGNIKHEIVDTYEKSEKFQSPTRIKSGPGTSFTGYIALVKAIRKLFYTRKASDRLDKIS